MAINIVDNSPIICMGRPVSPIDPVYTGTTGLGGVVDIGTVSVINFGNPIIDTTTGSGTTGVVLDPVLTDPVIDIRNSIDPCASIIIAGKTINNVTTSGATQNVEPFYDTVSGNVFTLNTITGVTANVVSKNAVLKPGYTVQFKDEYGNLNNGTALLPNKIDIISGATFYVNGVSIMDYNYRPFKVVNGTYLLTFISADYVNKKFFFSLTGDIVPSVDKPINTIYQNSFANISPVSWSIQNQQYTASVIELSYNQLFGTIRYDIDMIIQNTAVPYYQKGQAYLTTWGQISPYAISDMYAIKLPAYLGSFDKGLTFKFLTKQFVCTQASRLLIYSDTIRIISPYQKTYDTDLAVYLIEMNTAETIEIYFDGYDYIVTSQNKQPYMRISETALSVKDPNMAANNYVETNIDTLIN